MSSWKKITAFAILILAGACTAGGQDDIDPPQSNSSGGDTGQDTPPSSGSQQNPGSGTVPDPETETLSFDESAVFLAQATFGPSLTEIQTLENESASSWLEAQFDSPATLHLPVVLEKLPTGTTLDFSGDKVPEAKQFAINSFMGAAIMVDDQLRQRVAFALSQIIVTSSVMGAGLHSEPHAQAYYYDILVRNAFGNYRDILEEVTYSPAMAEYLTYLRNEKDDPSTGRVPDENYAREIMQLFTIGLVELNIDGSTKLQNGEPIETYTNEDITGLARVFTGFSYNSSDYWANPLDDDPSLAYTPLKIFPNIHSDLEKSFLGVTIPAGVSGSQSVDTALDTLFNHPNVAPFISKQLIQRFVTSNPSPEYVARVATAFETGSFELGNGNTAGAGERGDLEATIAAILLDIEARSPELREAESFGKIREPLIRFTHWARAFNVNSADIIDQIEIRDAENDYSLSQQILRSPSVFNFYRPGYIAPGSESGDANLAAPELQIITAASIPGYLNAMNRFIFNYARTLSGGQNTSYQPDYSYEIALADDPVALVNHLDQVIAGSRMLTSTKDRIISVLGDITIDDASREEDLTARAQTAVFMTFTAPEYIVQR